MADDSQCRIPLRTRSGDVRAWTQVDADDFDWLNQWRWSLSGGYACRSAKHGTPSMARLILGMERGDGLEADHINRGRLDNRRENLRVVTHAQNAHNRPSYPGTSSHRGVYWDAKGFVWRVTLEVEGTRLHFGTYVNEKDAAMIAQQARVRYLSHATD